MAKKPAKRKTGPTGPSKYNEFFLEKEAAALIEWCKKGEGLYLGQFALQRGYHRRRLQEFVARSVPFAEAYEVAQMWQEVKFIQNALTRKWDPSFTARVMARVCGPEWRNSWDKEEEVTDKVVNVTINKIKS